MIDVTDNIKNYKVLIVDDHRLSRELLSTQLKVFGFNSVDTCMDGSEALERVQVDKYDIIFTDWAMPVMDGLTFFKELTSSGYLEDAAFVMISAEAQPDKILEAIGNGISYYITKPIVQEQVNDKIVDVVKWLEQRRSN